jgi:hypothetical protein
VRAFLSDGYKIIDNLDVLLAVLDGVRQAGAPVQVDGCDLTERRMYVRVVCEQVRVLAPALLAGYRSPFTGVVSPSFADRDSRDLTIDRCNEPCHPGRSVNIGRLVHCPKDALTAAVAQCPLGSRLRTWDTSGMMPSMSDGSACSKCGGKLCVCGILRLADEQRLMRERSGPLYELAVARSRAGSAAWRSAGSPAKVTLVTVGNLDAEGKYHSELRWYLSAPLPRGEFVEATPEQVAAWEAWRATRP